VQKPISTQQHFALSFSSVSSSEFHVAPVPTDIVGGVDERNTPKSSNQRTSLAPTDARRDYEEHRMIRVNRIGTSIPQENFEQISIKNPRHHLDGYKYRLLKANLMATTQLTNQLVAIPETPAGNESLLTATPTTSQVREKENYYIHLLQQQYDNDDNREDPNHRLRRGIKHAREWWRTLYENMDQSKIAPGSYPQQKPQSSMRSRRSSVLLDEMINSDSYTGFLPDERESKEGDVTVSDRIRVRSVQAASSIDVVAVLSKVFGGGVARASQYTDQHPLSDFFATSPPLRHVFGRTNIIIQLSPPPSDGHPSLSYSVPRYVVVYRFGAVVFFNITTKESSRLLEEIKKYAVNPISIGFERREHFEVALQPHLETATGKITSDSAMVRELDMNTVGIVSNIMGQTVALDWHNDTVDELLAKFSSVNSSVERTGGFTSIERNTLFQVVARNNSLFIDMVGKLGIKDRSDTAWNLSQYEGLHEGMRKEFELDERFRVSCV
jgi:uncharacterized Rmd1/YagE family protein